jgi:hypothetical protein
MRRGGNLYSYSHITVGEVQEKSVLTAGSLGFSCYVRDTEGSVYRVKSMADCKRFRDNPGTTYAIEQTFDQEIVYAERVVP